MAQIVMKTARTVRFGRVLRWWWHWRYTGLVAIGLPIAALLALGIQSVVAIFWGFMVGLAFETLQVATRDCNPTLAILHTLAFLSIIYGLIGLGMII
jgi:hypothetical protein